MRVEGAAERRVLESPETDDQAETTGGFRTPAHPFTHLAHTPAPLELFPSLWLLRPGAEDRTRTEAYMS